MLIYQSVVGYHGVDWFSDKCAIPSGSWDRCLFVHGSLGDDSRRQLQVAENSLEGPYICIGSTHLLPSGKLKYLWKITIFTAKPHILSNFSIAM